MAIQYRSLNKNSWIDIINLDPNEVLNCKYEGVYVKNIPAAGAPAMDVLCFTATLRRHAPETLSLVRGGSRARSCAPTPRGNHPLRCASAPRRRPDRVVSIAVEILPQPRRHSTIKTEVEAAAAAVLKFLALSAPPPAASTTC
jgi:hypothetical protein